MIRILYGFELGALSCAVDVSGERWEVFWRFEGRCWRCEVAYSHGDDHVALCRRAVRQSRLSRTSQACDPGGNEREETKDGGAYTRDIEQEFFAISNRISVIKLLALCRATRLVCHPTEQSARRTQHTCCLQGINTQKGCVC